MNCQGYKGIGYIFSNWTHLRNALRSTFLELLQSMGLVKTSFYGEFIQKVAIFVGTSLSVHRRGGYPSDHLIQMVPWQHQDVELYSPRAERCGDQHHNVANPGYPRLLV